LLLFSFDLEERESRHTGATQLMEDLTFGSSSSSSIIEPISTKSKGKQKQVESDEDNDESEIISGDEDLDALEIQQEIKKRKRVTIREFVVYRLQIRDSNKTRSILHLSGRLFQQYLVDQYAKWESDRLRWYKLNQQKFRTEIFSGLQDIVSNEDFSYDKIGKKIILSSSFTGSIRYMQQLYQDSMAIVREFGKPDLFVTVTCNPNWAEITNELLPNQ